MKPIIRPLLAIAAITPMTATAALVSLNDSGSDSDQPAIKSQITQSQTPDLLNDPEPFRLTPTGQGAFSLVVAGSTEVGDGLLYVAAAPERSPRDKAEMMKKVEAKIKELKKAGKDEAAAGLSKRLAHFKEMTKQAEKEEKAVKEANAKKAEKKTATEAAPKKDSKKAGHKEHHHDKVEHKGHHHDKVEHKGHHHDRAEHKGHHHDRAEHKGHHHDRAEHRGHELRGRQLPSRRAGGGRADLRSQLNRSNLEAHRKLFHMRTAIMHLRAAGAKEVAERLEKSLKAQGQEIRAQLSEAIKKSCPDCKSCEKCADAQKAGDTKGCAGCAKDGKACTKCAAAKKTAAAKGEAGCAKDGKASTKCAAAKKTAAAKGCAGCTKDGKACTKCAAAKKTAAAKGEAAKKATAAKKAKAEAPAKPAPPSIDPSKLRAHLQARDARIGQAIGQLQSQVKDLRKQLDELRTKVDRAHKPAEKKAKSEVEKKPAPKRERKQNRDNKTSNVILIEV